MNLNLAAVIMPTRDSAAPIAESIESVVRSRSQIDFLIMK